MAKQLDAAGGVDKVATETHMIQFSDPPPAFASAHTSILSDPRFREPPGWRWHSFTASGGYKLRYGSVYPSETIADAVVVILPGLRDSGEQYLELAHALLARNLAVWVIDWRGQGGSQRYLKNPHKRHSAGFDSDLRDLRELVEGYILPSAVHPDVGRLPLIMLGHSTGAHLGLRFLLEHNTSAKGKQLFSVGAFCAPMFGVYQVDHLPLALSTALAALMSILPTAYVPGGRDWEAGFRDMAFRKGRYTHDEMRGALQDAWFSRKPDLQIGSPTTRWLFDALRSCLKLRKPSYLKKMTTPTLVASAGDDRIVSNRMTRRAIAHIPDVRHIEIFEAQHEILMEADKYRDEFLSHFFTFIEENVLNKSDRGVTKF